MLNILSVDVEDYHDQLALDFQNRIVPPDEEAVRATDRLLDLFSELDVRGTFFILGEIAEHFPDLVRRVAGQGHHLGVHGYYHHLVFRQTADEFRRSIDAARKRIEDVAGVPADAYRATAFSINASTPWALGILADLGFRYDSSVYPFKGRRYGDPTAPRAPYKRHLPDGRWLWEVPMSTVVKWGRRWPVCGGGYFRLMPLGITDRAVAGLNAEGIGAVIYLHPYETELAPQINPLSGLSWRQWAHFRFFNFHQQVGRAHTITKLRYLLGKYRFGTLRDAIAELENPQTNNEK